MSASVTLSPGTPQPGETLAGKYLIEGVLGAGGMGVVLSARHVDLGQPVAIKFLNAQFSHHPEILARFLREARSAAAIKSEHVARVLDVTRTETGVPYIVMEHLDGSDLEQLVRARGPLPIAEAIDYVLQACEAIAEAHAAKIVHRDLKPANLFLTHRADGSSLVKVLDFGMSKLMAQEGVPQDGSLTSPAAVLGSPWYMSPEQVKSTKNVDHRTDVWSLGIIVQKLVTGAQAFEAETITSCLVKIVTEPPIPLRTRRPDAPAELEAVVLRCLEKDVDRRFQNVAELARALLPFAPERSRVSVERIGRVLFGEGALADQTLLLPTTAAGVSPVVPEVAVEPPTLVLPARAPADGSSPALAASSAVLAPASRWTVAAAVVVAAVALAVGGGLAGMRWGSGTPAASVVAAPPAPPQVATVAPSPPAPTAEASAAPEATATVEAPPAATATAEAPSAQATAAPPTVATTPPAATAPPATAAPPANKPAVPPKPSAAPTTPPVKRKVQGPMEPTL